MNVVDCPMEPNDAEAETIGDYLRALLLELWYEGEGFSGKRPFGDSSWEYDLYKALGQAGLIDITFDDDGYVDEVDSATADKLVAAAIKGLR